jgi:hypothetical protein
MAEERSCLMTLFEGRADSQSLKVHANLIDHEE